MNTNERQVQTAAVLANAGELMTGVIKQIAGNSISNTIGGSRITTEVIQALIYQRIMKQVTAPIAAQ